MTPEQRFDRLERIVKLMIKAGLRARTLSREQDQKITILIDAQIKNEDQFARTDQKIAKLAELQARSDRKLEELGDIVRNGRSGPATN